MGKLVIEGRAEKEYIYDVMALRVNFVSDGFNTRVFDNYRFAMRLSDEDFDSEKFKYSNQIEAPTEKKSAKVEVIWIIE